MELNQISGDVTIKNTTVNIKSVELNDSDVFGNGETDMPCFQILINSEKDYLGLIGFTVEDSIFLKNRIEIFLEKIKCGIKPQYINEEYKANL